MRMQQQDRPLTVVLEQAAIMFEAETAVRQRHREFRNDPESLVPALDRINEAAHGVELVGTIGEDLAAAANVELDKAMVRRSARKRQDLLFTLDVLPIPGTALARQLLFGAPGIRTKVLRKGTLLCCEFAPLQLVEQIQRAFDTTGELRI